jgi:hypothetical protein
MASVSPSEALSVWRRRFETFGQNNLPPHRRLALAAIGIGCAFLLISWRFSGPAYLKDEIGYLANAAFLAGRMVDAASSYHAGYSLFIAPAFWLSDPAFAWKAMLAINAVLWAASFAMLHSILRRLLPDTSSSTLLTATMVSALYPTWIVSSGYAFATAAFVAVFLASILALFVWSPSRLLSVLPHSALAGSLYWVHPTGAAVALASLLAFAFDAYRRRDAKVLGLHVVLLATLFIGYRWGIQNWITASMTPSGYQPRLHYPSLTSALQTVLTWQGFAVFATVLVGQFAYFIVASFGMAFAGMAFCMRRFASLRNTGRSRGDADPGARLVWLYIGAAPLWIMALGAISFFQWDHFEGDFWIYGRYVDAVILPVLAIGLAAFQADIRFAVLSIALLAAGVLLDLMVPSNVQHNIVNTVSFWPQYLAKGSGFFVWMLIGAIAIAAVARAGRKLAVGLMAAAFPLAVYHQVTWHEWILTNFSAPSSLVGIIRSNVPPGTCVGFDPALPADATFFQTERYQLNSFYLFNYQYRRMSPAEWIEQCDGPYLTYDASNLLASGRARLVAREIKSNLLLVQRSDRTAMTIPKNASPDIEVAP